MGVWGRKWGVYKCEKCTERKPRCGYLLSPSLVTARPCDECRLLGMAHRAKRKAEREEKRRALEAKRQTWAALRKPPSVPRPRPWPPERVVALERVLTIDGLTYDEAAARLNTSRGAIAGAITTHLPHLRKKSHSRGLTL